MKKKLIVLLGLPRSGTTLSTAMFDVNPNILAWFEPWNVRQKQLPEALQSVEDFKVQYKKIFNIDISDKQTLMFKETTSNLLAIEWTDQSIKNMIQSDDVDVKVVWLVRDINHAYLSRIHTAREHWGHPNMKIDTGSFKEFVNFAYTGMKSIEDIINKYNSCVLSYERLVTDTEMTLSKVMDFLGIELHSNQLEYHKHFKNHKSAGDPEVTNSPKPINPEKIINKDSEWEEYKDVFLESLNKNEYYKYMYMNEIVKDIRNFGFKQI